MIAAQSPMIVCEDSSGPSGQISSDNVQAHRVENEDPLDLRAFYFQKAAPPIVKREISRVHFRLGYGEFVNDDGEESFGLFGLKSSLFLF